MDVVAREPDREEADGDQHDAEDRVHGGEVRPPRARLDGEPQHEIRRVEKEEDEEQHELLRAPEPPMTPAVPGPDRTGKKRHRGEDHALVDRDVALQIGTRLPFPEVEKSLPRAPTEA